MRILYLNPSGQMGGAETSLLELLASVRTAAPDWELWLVLGGDGPLASKARELGVRVMVAPFPPGLARLGDAGNGRLATLYSLLKASPRTAIYVRRLAGIIRQIRPDMVHTTGFKMHLLGAITHSRQAPLIWHIHDYVRTRPLMSRLLRRYAKRCAAVIVNSNSVRADVKTLTPDAKVVTIYNAIDLERFSPQGPRMDLDERSGMPSAGLGVVRVGLVATFARWKGQKVFLKALSLLPPSLPVRGYIIGGPIYQTAGSQFSVEELRAEVARLGIQHKLGLTGFVDDAAAAMRALDIVVHASTEPEPFGMVIAEAMACGKPVIASSAGGALEVFEDEWTGLGHPAGDAAGLARRIEQLVEDSSLRSRLASAGMSDSRRRFSPSRLSGELVAMYGKFGGQTPRAGLFEPAHL